MTGLTSIQSTVREELTKVLTFREHSFNKKDRYSKTFTFSTKDKVVDVTLSYSGNSILLTIQSNHIIDVWSGDEINWINIPNIVHNLLIMPSV